MRKIAIALLTTTMLAAPAFAGSNNKQQPQNQQQGQMQQHQQPNQQNAQAQKNQQNGQQNQQNGQPQESAQNNQPIPPDSLSREQVRQVQRALDKEGFKAGPTDGRWGSETEDAVKQFQQRKQLQSTGQLDQQTVADLGLDASKFQPKNQQQGQQQ